MNLDRPKVLAVITARGGSKGLPRKNVLYAGGKPLIAWTVDAALNSKFIDRVVLSTDDDEIIEVAKSCNCEIPFRRPTHLSSDAAKSIDVVLHALDQIPGYDYVILLQPTSPLRTGADIDAAFSLMRLNNAPACVSVCLSDQSPYWMFQIADKSRLKKLLPRGNSFSRRQDLPDAFVLNGAIYIGRVDWLIQKKSFLGNGCIAYVMPKERSLDIDTADDFASFKQIVDKPHPQHDLQ